MITAKGLKQTSQSQQSPPTREDYAETEQGKRSIAPLAFLLFLTGCAAYLKSFLPARIEAREAEQVAKQDNADQNETRSEDGVGLVPEEPAPVEDVAPGDGRTRYSSDNVIPIRLVQESGAGVAVGTGSVQSSTPLPVKIAAPNEDVFRSNDIRPPTASSSGDGGGGSGGGGGGAAAAAVTVGSPLHVRRIHP